MSLPQKSPRFCSFSVRLLERFQRTKLSSHARRALGADAARCASTSLCSLRLPGTGSLAQPVCRAGAAGLRLEGLCLEGLRLLSPTPSRRTPTWQSRGQQRGRSCPADCRAAHVSSTCARGEKLPPSSSLAAGGPAEPPRPRPRDPRPATTEPRRGWTAGRELRGGGPDPPTPARAHKMAPSARPPPAPLPPQRPRHGRARRPAGP